MLIFTHLENLNISHSADQDGFGETFFNATTKAELFLIPNSVNSVTRSYVSNLQENVATTALISKVSLPSSILPTLNDSQSQLLSYYDKLKVIVDSEAKLTSFQNLYY